MGASQPPTQGPMNSSRNLPLASFRAFWCRYRTCRPYRLRWCGCSPVLIVAGPSCSGFRPRAQKHFRCGIQIKTKANPNQIKPNSKQTQTKPNPKQRGSFGECWRCTCRVIASVRLGDDPSHSTVDVFYSPQSRP